MHPRQLEALGVSIRREALTRRSTVGGGAGVARLAQSAASHGWLAAVPECVVELSMSH